MQQRSSLPGSMFYSTFGYAQLAAQINISCTIVAADGGRQRGEEIKGGWR